MESMESHEAGFPPFPHSLEIPSGFPHSHGLDDWIYVFSCPLNSNHRHRKGLVTDVSGPQRNACPGTLIRRTPRAFRFDKYRIFRGITLQVRLRRIHLPTPADGLRAQECRLRLKRSTPHASRGSPPFKSSTASRSCA